MFERNIRFGNIRIEEHTKEGIKVKVLRRDRLKQALRELFVLSLIEKCPAFFVVDVSSHETWTVKYNGLDSIEKVFHMHNLQRAAGFKNPTIKN